jgi:nucleoside-diphosphate-sugar epimerase
MIDDNRLHVVLGTGPLGLAVVRSLASRNDRVRVVNRGGTADLPAGVEAISADVEKPAEAIRVCQGAAVIYHCANPPYHKWPELHPPLMDAIIEGASSANAKLVFGDNLYAYGPVDGPLTEAVLNRAMGPNGKTRAAISETLMRAHESGRLRAAIGRGSDFFGPHVHQSAAGDRVFANALRGRPAQVLGDPDLPHTVTFIDDFARALITLGDRDEALGQIWHVPNDETVTMRRFVESVFAAVGGEPALKATPRWMMTMAGIFSPTIRALAEQRYQTERPWVVDSSKFERAFGWTATRLTEAVSITAGWWKSLR